MQQIEKIGAMAERLQLSRHRAHDGYDDAIFKFGIDGLEAFNA
jgi:hypothetical protein